ncbi:MAG: hypothetical protein Q7W13_02825 [Bacteroidia bacterium]|nr:hypothetical protein [Bacteroidia bacterium]
MKHYWKAYNSLPTGVSTIAIRAKPTAQAKIAIELTPLPRKEKLLFKISTLQNF